MLTQLCIQERASVRIAARFVCVVKRVESTADTSLGSVETRKKCPNPTTTTTSMYFAAAAPAKRLLLGTSKPNNDEEEPLSPTLKGLAKLGGAKEESIVAVEADADGELVAVLTQSELSIWSAKVGASESLHTAHMSSASPARSQSDT